MFRKLVLLNAAVALSAVPVAASAGLAAPQRSASHQTVRSAEQVEGSALYGGNQLLYAFVVVTIVAVILALTLRGGDEDPASP